MASLSRTDQTDLLPVLYEGVADGAAWARFLARLRRRARAGSAELLLVDDAGAARLWRDGGEKPAGGDPLQRLHAAWPQALRRLRPERVYDRRDLLDLLAPDGLPGDVGDLRLVHVAEPERAALWLMLSRTGEAFAAADGALLSALAPHLRVAVRLLAQQAAMARRLARAEDAAARLGVGWMALDAQGRPRDASAAARAMLATVPHAAERIANAVARGRGATRVSVAPPLDVLLQAEDGAALLRGGVPAPAPDALAMLYGLSASEARLASALCGGATLAEAGAAAGLSLETARTYSKRLFARVGARGQADLVRVILSGAAPLAR